MNSRTRSRRPTSIGSNQSSRRWIAVSACDCRADEFVLLLLMAWSPPALKTPALFGFQHPETTPPSIPTTPRTAPRGTRQDSGGRNRQSSARKGRDRKMGGDRLGLAAPTKASSHSRCCLCHCPPVSARQSNSEFSELADPAIDGDRAAMLLGHDVVADREAEARPLAGRLGRKEWLEQLVLDLGRNASAVVPHRDLDRISEISRRHLQSGLELRVISLLTALGGGVEAVADQVETDAGDVLRDKFDRGDRVSKISLQRDVETRILARAP